jgi:hypothetical protein
MSKRTYDLIYRAVSSCNDNIGKSRLARLRKKLLIISSDRRIVALKIKSRRTGLLLDQFSKQAPRAVARDGIDYIEEFSAQVY